MSNKKDILPPGKNAAEWLDFAIKNCESKFAEAEKYYELNDRRYYNYMDNESWSAFVDMMSIKHSDAYKAYCQGSGCELEKRKTIFGYHPPKMASYGSSSRMIYLYSREIPGFCFEEQLPTTIGGTANMDGYLYCGDTYYYIEAKCREPYSSKSHIINCKYKDLYRSFGENPILDFKCEIKDSNKDDEIYVKFFAQGKEISRFDVKQMISHLLGIATKHLKKPTEDRIHFVYLLYNPKEIESYIDDLRHCEKIFNIYKTVVTECESIPFKALFKMILWKLHSLGVGIATNEQIEQMADNFSFKLYDQETYINLINEIFSKTDDI